MISSQRQHLILSRLRTRGAVRITALSKELGVSAMTIRRDIADLADKGLLKRVHGGAVSTSTLLSEPLFSVKSQMDIGLKDAIAQEAVKYVAPGDVIAIGGGTTAYVFAQHLLESQQSSGITILTNSIPVAELVQALESKDVEVIVTGGVTTRSNSLVEILMRLTPSLLLMSFCSVCEEISQSEGPPIKAIFLPFKWALIA